MIDWALAACLPAAFLMKTKRKLNKFIVKCGWKVDSLIAQIYLIKKKRIYGFLYLTRRPEASKQLRKLNQFLPFLSLSTKEKKLEWNGWFAAQGGPTIKARLSFVVWLNWIPLKKKGYGPALLLSINFINIKTKINFSFSFWSPWSGKNGMERQAKSTLWLIGVSEMERLEPPPIDFINWIIGWPPAQGKHKSISLICRAPPPSQQRHSTIKEIKFLLSFELAWLGWLRKVAEWVWAGLIHFILTNA